MSAYGQPNMEYSLPGQMHSPAFAPEETAEIEAAMGDDASSAVRQLLPHAHRVRYRQQDVLYHQGDPGQTVLFITAGLLKLVAYLPNGRARIVRLHRPGSVLGLGALRGGTLEHTAIAVTPISALRLPLSTLKSLRSRDPAAYVGLVERWHDYLLEADLWITQFSTGPIRARVARLLAFLAKFEPADSDEGHVQLLTCEEMGSILGVTGESVSRTLADFKRRRILAHSPARPPEHYDTDVPQLRHIAREE